MTVFIFLGHFVQVSLLQPISHRHPHLPSLLPSDVKQPFLALRDLDDTLGDGARERWGGGDVGGGIEGER